MRGSRRASLQLVVGNEKEAARKAFAKKFNAELDRVEIPPDRARVSAVHKRLKKDQKPLVSREQVRKWVRGIDIPDTANLRIVVERLKLDWIRLQPGASHGAATDLFLKLKAAWDALESDQARQQLIDYAHFLGSKDGTATKARPEGSESEGERASLQRHRRA